MAENPSPQAYWRTKKIIRRRPVAPVLEHSASPSKASASDGDSTDGQQNGNQLLMPTPDDLSKTPREALITELQKPVDQTGSHEFPQADGFLGLYLRILLWRMACLGTAYAEHVSPYSNRVGCFQNQTVKLGEGASFTVSRRFDVGSLLGRASKLVVMKNSKIKFEDNGNVNDCDGFQSLLAEIKVLTLESIRGHSNIVKLLDIRWDHPSMEQDSLGPTLYLEYAELGTLADFRISHHERFSEIKTSQSILRDICKGLGALHRCHITHGDIKPSNILLFEEHGQIIAKISDFGSAIFTSTVEEQRIRLPGLSPPWDAPETGSQIATGMLHKSDIYSFGLVYWWYRHKDSDPFGVDSTQGNIFGFKGDRFARLDALKTLKQNQDLEAWAYKSMAKSNNQSHMSKEVGRILER
jgi:serine/threonine protein kinase